MSALASLRWAVLPPNRSSGATILATDLADLDRTEQTGVPSLRWSLPTDVSVVTGLSQRVRTDSIVDVARCDTDGVRVLVRQAGGGLVLMDCGLLCLTAALPRPHPLVEEDIRESYRWLGTRLATGLAHLGAHGLWCVDPREPRSAHRRPLAAGAEEPVLADVCFARLSAYEVTQGPLKLVGLAQVRRSGGVLFQAGILLRDQSGLARYLRGASGADFEAGIQRRCIGLDRCLDPAIGVPDVARVLMAAISNQCSPQIGKTTTGSLV